MDKAYVAPFLFDIKRAEVNGPILQFQSTIFEKADIKKLLTALNKACGESNLSDSMLVKAFDMCYPTLETELNKLKDIESAEEIKQEDIAGDTKDNTIIEEILELSRDNQKLLRNPDSKTNDQLAEIKQRLDVSLSRYERNVELDDRRMMSRKYRPMFMEEITHEVLHRCQKQYGFLIALSLFKDDFPWIYNMGKELFDLIQSDVTQEIKRESIKDFERLLEFTCGHPIMRDTFGRSKDMRMMLREMPHRLMDMLHEIELEVDIENCKTGD